MNDMTRGPVSGHVMRLAGFIALSTAFQTLYFLADLYFVGQLGKEAVAGVSLAGTVMFLVLALTQSLGVGATCIPCHRGLAPLARIGDRRVPKRRAAGQGVPAGVHG